MDPRSLLRLELLDACPRMRSWDDALGAAVFGGDGSGTDAPLECPPHLPLARVTMACLGGGVARAYLKADICRPDLSVEIEAVGERP